MIFSLSQTKEQQFSKTLKQKFMKKKNIFFSMRLLMKMDVSISLIPMKLLIQICLKSHQMFIFLL